MTTHSRTNANSPVGAVDLFCGAGGLTNGLVAAGIDVVAGINTDKQMQYAYEHNNGNAKFLCQNVELVTPQDVKQLLATNKYRLLAGCHTCQPFSNLVGKKKFIHHQAFQLLDHFGRLVACTLPEFVLMENVPGLRKRGHHVFQMFLRILEDNQYHVD